MLTFPNAKINIGLFVTGKREDGYHDLETIFYPVAVKDALEIIDNNKQKPVFHLTGLPVAGDQEKNLVWKAYTLLRNEFPQLVKTVSIFLHKLIPMGAGMGGGSANGAFMLKMLNDHFSLGLNREQLEQYALLLGSDCPFFIQNRPAFASGRGELLEELDIDLSGYSIQVVYPNMHISTAAAFEGITPGPAACDLRQITALPISEWKEKISNDFENSLFPQYTILKNIKEQLYAQGALYASLSGSGSAMYGIFEKGERAVIDRKTLCTTHYLL